MHRPRSRRKTFVARLRGYSFRIIFCLITVTGLMVVSLRWLDPPTSAFAIRAYSNGHRPVVLWSDWDNISPWLPIAVIASEDQKFPLHWGFDFSQIRDAVAERQLGRIRGASTISQQLAKNLFLWPGRSLWRKGLEAYFTVLLEAALPKQRILELYLNLVEFGPGIFGVGAAASEYFATTPSSLSRVQASLMAAVLPNPNRLRLRSPSEYVRTRAADIRNQITALGGTNYLRRLHRGNAQSL